MSGLVGKELEESSRTLASIDPDQIWDIANALVKVFRNGGKLIVFGNGGSAADAQHLAAEFSGRYLMERAPMNAIALTNLSSITAIGNDYSYDLIFERQVEAYATPKDAVIGISTSGNSKNVLLAIAKAKQLGAVTIGFTGTKGRLKDEVDLALTIPSEKTPRIQEGYFAAGHIICGTGGEGRVRPEGGLRRPGRHGGQGRSVLQQAGGPEAVPRSRKIDQEPQRRRLPGHPGHQPIRGRARLFHPGDPGQDP